MARPKSSNCKVRKDPGYKWVWNYSEPKDGLRVTEAKDGFFFVENGKSWLVTTDYDLAKLPEGRHAIVSAIISAVADGMGADAEEGYHFYIHDMHGVSYYFSRMSDGFVTEEDDVRRRLEKRMA